MANTLLPEVGVNVHQHYVTSTASTTKSDNPVCVIGELFQIKYDEPVSISDTTVYSSVEGVFDAQTKFLSDASLPANITNLLKVVIESPSHLAGMFDIVSIDNTFKRIKIDSANFVPTSGSSNVRFKIYNPNKNYNGYAMEVRYPGLVETAKAEEAPVVKKDSVIVKINDINGDHIVPDASLVQAIANAKVEVNGNVAKLIVPNGTSLQGVSTSTYLKITSPESLAGFYKINSVQTVKERTQITADDAASINGGDYFTIKTENGDTFNVWYQVGSNVKEVVTAVAKAGLVGSEYFTVPAPDGTAYKFWYEVEDHANVGTFAGTAPAGANTVKVSVMDNDTDAAIATKTKTAIESTSAFTVAVVGNTMTITAADFGPAVAPSNSNGVVSISVLTQGMLQIGVAPSATGTSIMVALALGNESAATVANLTGNAITGATQAFTVAVQAANITIECKNAGDTIDATKTGLADFIVTNLSQGEKSITITSMDGKVPSNTLAVDASVYTVGKLANDSTFIITPGVPYKGQVKVSYKASRRDGLYKFMRYQYISDLEAAFGATDDPENPVICGMALAMQNTGESQEVLGVAIESDTSEAHDLAVELLNNKKEAYFVIPLTQEVAYAQKYENHALSISDPYERHEACAIVNRALPVYATAKESGSVGGPAISGGSNFGFHAVDGSTVELTFVDDSPANDFYMLGLQLGYKVKFTVVVGNAKKTVVLPVIDPLPSLATKDTIALNINPADPEVEMGTVTRSDLLACEIYKYEIISEFFNTTLRADKARQAQEMTLWLRNKSIAVSSTYANQSSRRIVVIMPDLCEMATSRGARVVPGYFVACAIAGIKAVLSPSAPVAERAISGITKVYHSTDYFSSTQIRTMESAGCMFFYQPTEDSAPRGRRQLTNDMSSIKTQEWSTVHSVDVFAKRLRTALTVLAGKSTMNDNLLTNQRLTIEAHIARGKEDGLIKDATVKEFGVDPTATDHTYTKIAVDTFDPFNVMDVHLYI